MIAVKAFRTFICVYHLSKSEHLSTNIKLTLHKALIRSIMTYAYPSQEFVVDPCLLRLQCLLNKVFHTGGNFPRCTPTREWHAVFSIPYVCLAQVASRSHTKSWKSMSVTEAQAKPDTESARSLNLAVVRHTNIQVT